MSAAAKMKLPVVVSFTVFTVLFMHSANAFDVYRMSVDIFEEKIFETKDHKSSHLTKEANKNYEPPKAPQAFTFAKHFQDHMVLQKAPQRANIYGFSPDIGQKVIMQVNAPSKQYYYSTTVEKGPEAGVGVWSIMIDPFAANVTVSIKVESEQGSLSLNDVIFGDVWLCSGQSNMEFTVPMMMGAEEEIADAKNYPNVRLITVTKKFSKTPVYDLLQLDENWSKPSNATVGNGDWTYFSAVCWLFGKNIHKELGYPIGLVATDWGGTPVEAWSSPEALKKCDVTGESETIQPASYDSYVDTLPPEQRYKLQGQDDNSQLWNAMVYPLLEMTIYGAIWYQGEADAAGVKMNRYNCTFPEMIADWRLNFNKASQGQTSDSFPFGFVQLAPNTPDPTTTVGFPDIRWHQTADYGYVPNERMPNVFMSVAMDLPDFDSPFGSIHPRYKKEVGDRLVLSGMDVAYGKKSVSQGPLPVNISSSGTHLVIDYGNKWTLDVRDWAGFELLCGKRWLPTSITSSTATTVTTFAKICAKGEELNGIRYAWRESPCALKQCAVYETVNGLPGPPFVAYPQKDSHNELKFSFGGQVKIQ